MVKKEPPPTTSMDTPNNIVKEGAPPKTSGEIPNKTVKEGHPTISRGDTSIEKVGLPLTSSRDTPNNMMEERTTSGKTSNKMDIEGLPLTTSRDTPNKMVKEGTPPTTGGDTSKGTVKEEPPPTTSGTTPNEMIKGGPPPATCENTSNEIMKVGPLSTTSGYNPNRIVKEEPPPTTSKVTPNEMVKATSGDTSIKMMKEGPSPMTSWDTLNRMVKEELPLTTSKDIPKEMVKEGPPPVFSGDTPNNMVTEGPSPTTSGNTPEQMIMEGLPLKYSGKSRYPLLRLARFCNSSRFKRPLKHLRLAWSNMMTECTPREALNVYKDVFHMRLRYAHKMKQVYNSGLATPSMDDEPKWMRYLEANRHALRNVSESDAETEVNFAAEQLFSYPGWAEHVALLREKESALAGPDLYRALQEHTRVPARFLQQYWEQRVSLWSRQLRWSLLTGDVRGVADADVAVLCGDITLLSQEVFKSRGAEMSLTKLVNLVACFHDTGLPSAILWATLLSEFTALGYQVSGLVLQRRWYECVVWARSAAISGQLEVPLPFMLMLKRFPEIVTSPIKSWAWLLQHGRVFTEEQLNKVPLFEIEKIKKGREIRMHFCDPCPGPLPVDLDFDNVQRDIIFDDDEDESMNLDEPKADVTMIKGDLMESSQTETFKGTPNTDQDEKLSKKLSPLNVKEEHSSYKDLDELSSLTDETKLLSHTDHDERLSNTDQDEQLSDDDLDEKSLYIDEDNINYDFINSTQCTQTNVVKEIQEDEDSDTKVLDSCILLKADETFNIDLIEGDNVTGRRGGAGPWRAPKVHLQDIDSVRRINRGILTAQVAPITIAHYWSERTKASEVTVLVPGSSTQVEDLQQDTEADTQQAAVSVDPLYIVEPVKEMDHMGQKKNMDPDAPLEQVNPVAQKINQVSDAPLEHVNSVDQIKNVDIVVPEEPVDHVNLVDPIDLVDQVKKVDLMSSVDTKNVEPVDFMNKVKPVDHVHPVDPNDHVDQVNKDTMEPAGKVGHVDPVNQVDTVGQMEPLDPVNQPDSVEQTHNVDHVLSAKQLKVVLDMLKAKKTNQYCCAAQRHIYRSSVNHHKHSRKGEPYIWPPHKHSNCKCCCRHFLNDIPKNLLKEKLKKGKKKSKEKKNKSSTLPTELYKRPENVSEVLSKDVDAANKEWIRQKELANKLYGLKKPSTTKAVTLESIKKNSNAELVKDQVTLPEPHIIRVRVLKVAPPVPTVVISDDEKESQPTPVMPNMPLLAINPLVLNQTLNPTVTRDLTAVTRDRFKQRQLPPPIYNPVALGPYTTEKEFFADHRHLNPSIFVLRMEHSCVPLRVSDRVVLVTTEHVPCWRPQLYSVDNGRRLAFLGPDRMKEIQCGVIVDFNDREVKKIHMMTALSDLNLAKQTIMRRSALLYDSLNYDLVPVFRRGRHGAFKLTTATRYAHLLGTLEERLDALATSSDEDEDRPRHPDSDSGYPLVESRKPTKEPRTYSTKRKKPNSK